MDFAKLDDIVTDFINNNKLKVETLPYVIDYCKKVYSEPVDTSNIKWSRKVDLKESINTVYNFLKTIDSNMSEQFLNVISSDDVKLLPRDEYPNGRDEVDNGKVYIHYENTPKDAFIILHEVLHKMNDCKIVINGYDFTETHTRDYLGETVSILGEKMLGQYMVDNGIITESDFDKRKTDRLLDTRQDVRDIIIENELIQMKLQGKEINYQNLMDLTNKYTGISMEYGILNDEKNDLRRINKILENEHLSLPVAQRYVIGQELSSEISKRDTVKEDFIKLHHEVGNANSNLNNVYNEVILKSFHNKEISKG